MVIASARELDVYNSLFDSWLGIEAFNEAEGLGGLVLSNVNLMRLRFSLYSEALFLLDDELISITCYINSKNFVRPVFFLSFSVLSSLLKQKS